MKKSVNILSICNYPAQWEVYVTCEGINPHGELYEYYIEQNGNTFAECLNALWDQDGATWGSYLNDEAMDELTIGGTFNAGLEDKEFTFAVNAESLATMCHYAFDKGRASVEDIMYCSCKESEFFFTDLPLDAFTAGSNLIAKKYIENMA